jgi:hypothetical protein
MEMETEDATPAQVDARFCAPDAASLTAAKAPSMSGSDFAVTDAALFSLRRRCVLVDADRCPVLTVQESVGPPPLLPRSSLPHASILELNRRFSLVAVGAGASAEHAVEGVLRRQHEPA